MRKTLRLIVGLWTQALPHVVSERYSDRVLCRERRKPFREICVSAKISPLPQSGMHLRVPITKWSLCHAECASFSTGLEATKLSPARTWNSQWGDTHLKKEQHKPQQGMPVVNMVAILFGTWQYMHLCVMTLSYQKAIADSTTVLNMLNPSNL